MTTFYESYFDEVNSLKENGFVDRGFSVLILVNTGE